MTTLLRKSLNSENVQVLLKEIYNDNELKAKILTEISFIGLTKVLQNRFRLTLHQKEELKNIIDRDIENIFNNSITSAIRRNGKIELINERHNPPNLRVEFYARGGGGIEVGVRVTC